MSSFEETFPELFEEHNRKLCIKVMNEECIGGHICDDTCQFLVHQNEVESFCLSRQRVREAIKNSLDKCDYLEMIYIGDLLKELGLEDE